MRYPAIVVICAALAIPGCAARSGFVPATPAESNAPEISPAAKVEYIEQKVDDIKKKTADAEKRVKDIEQNVKKGEGTPAPAPKP